MVIEQLGTTPTSFIPAPAPELLNLSRVCKVLRALTLPYVLQDITLLNDEKSGSSVLAVLNSSDAGLVQNLHYIGVMAMAPDSSDGIPEEFQLKPSPEHLPNSVEQVLSSLAMLPNLAKVIVEFRCGKTAEEDEEIYGGSYNIYEESETNDEILTSENTDAFRSLMERSYKALTQNATLSIKHLELRNMVAKRCSAWWSVDFLSVLQSLCSFTISLRGGNNGAGWCINKVEAYLDFITMLDNVFFQHLSNVKHLCFSATEDGPPGLEGEMNHARLPLHGNSMPMLQTLELRHVFISKELATFINFHGGSIKTVRLHACYSGLGDCLSFGPISWEEFFFIAAAENFRCLRTFDVGPSSLESADPESIGETYWNHKEVMRAKKLREEEFPGRRMFEYRCLDDKYGMLFEDKELTFQRFQDGRDHAAWELLSKVLKKNAEAE